MQNLEFDNTFVRTLPGDPDAGPHRRQVHGALYSRVHPTPVSAPNLLAWSPETAALVGLTEQDATSPRFARIFGGNGLLDGMEPFAANYGGHQFGHWAGQLGDGRAISLGEVVNAAGQRWELQLKGAGPTPYSRTADGRAVLRSSVREFLCSEAMHHLGVPTTRALSLVATGDEVVRDMFYDGRPRAEPGAIVCRVAQSFVRFGNFELPASRGDVPLLGRLVDFVIRRDFPELAAGGADPSSTAVRVEWFGRVCERTARMVVHWQRVGFVHGVMNTDNMSILGLTIDYGPYGWIDDFDPDWTPNTTDAAGRRYRFGQQPQVAHWNLAQLANALMPLVQDVQPLADGLDRFVAEYERAWRGTIAAKLGLADCRDDDVGLMETLHDWMHAAEVDMTLFFRALSATDVNVPDPARFAAAFYDGTRAAAEQPRFDAWWTRYVKRIAQDRLDPATRRARMEAANPCFVLRNYLAQQVIDRAEQGDPAGIHELLDVLRRPYDEQPGREGFAARRPDWARTRPGCSMLSCSS